MIKRPILTLVRSSTVSRAFKIGRRQNPNNVGSAADKVDRRLATKVNLRVGIQRSGTWGERIRLILSYSAGVYSLTWRLEATFGARWKGCSKFIAPLQRFSTSLG